MNAYVTNLYPKPSAATTAEQLTVDQTAGGLSFATTFAAHTDVVVVDVQANDAMMTVDGTAPTTTNGIRIYAGRAYTWSKSWAQAAKFLSTSATDCILYAQEGTF